MNGRVTLRGMAWDHPRGRNPLEVISSDWAGKTNNTFEWVARPLKDFEDQPLEELATHYDLILIDYPFTGTAATSRLFSPVDDWVDTAYLRDQRDHAVGPSSASYTWFGKQWALAIDAACQVSAGRKDLCTVAGVENFPDSWDEVELLAAELKNAPGKVGIPLNPNHCYCAFVSVGLGLGGGKFWPVGSKVDEDAALESLATLRRLCKNIHPASRTDDPIGVSDMMASTDELVYVPLMFGYSSYARLGFRDKLLSFGNAPRGACGMRGSVLGGVGMALSAQSEHPAEAADLARRITAHDVQSDLYVDSGGQPGHGAAWESSAVNAQVGGFFRSTRATIENAFVRPRVAGHWLFQQLAGELIHGCIWSGDISIRACLVEYNKLQDKLLADWALEELT